MLKIGLTGGIGSGKSTVAGLFHDYYSVPIIDADIIAREIVEPGESALELLKKKFGSVVFNADNTLNRKKLREIVFSNSTKKKELEAILHPLIYKRMQKDFDKRVSAYSIFCIPLLIETKMNDFVDRVLVIDCSEKNQIDRVSRRDSFSIKLVKQIISTQVSREHRLAIADDIIDNSDSSLQLVNQVKKLHNYYLLLADSRTN